MKMKTTVLLASIVLIILLFVMGCSSATQPTSTATSTTTKPVATSTSTPTTTTKVEYKEPIYRIINPVGIDQPVDLSPLAKRIDGLAGKTIAVCMAEGSPMVMPTLMTRIKKEFPTSTFVFTESRTTGPTRLTTDEEKGVQAMIIGNSW